jgi:5-methyltetrahydropteroyltriglutamate--homocysteine methyltransferase
MAKSTILGYPRIGKQRELKRAVERYWAGKSSADELQQAAVEVRQAARSAQQAAGIDLIPANDFTFYDHILDTAWQWGLIPQRFGAMPAGNPLDTYFAMARGAEHAPALEMTKWFDTNYHYLVPEFDGPAPRRNGNAALDAYREAREQVGAAAKPVLVGPVTFVLLGKHHTKSIAAHVADLVPLYQALLADLAAAGAAWVQIDEPCLVQDRTAEELQLYATTYAALAGAAGTRPKIMLQSYFGSLGDNWDAVMALPVEGVGLDLVRDRRNLDDLLAKGFSADKVLGAGIVNGRNVWRSDLSAAFATLERIAAGVDRERIWVGPSASLMFLPHDVNLESGHDAEVLANLAFAEQRLDEIVTLTRGLNEGRAAVDAALARDRARLAARAGSSALHEPTQRRVAALTEDDFRRSEPFEERYARQQDWLQLPAYPTTTIGSYPQAGDVRSMRAKVRSGRISQDEYDAYVKGKIDALIAQQESVGLDVLVHGEFERTDMVEYFGEQLAGFIVTEHGWVQSYGSRCVRPPIVVGDVHRPQPMTVDWITYAQSRTSKPVKGMLTGPVTILNWSFVREDIPREQVAYQIGLALRDEVVDLERAGIKVIQIDEPALREGLPLRRANWGEYLRWAVRSFRLSASGVRPETQIHSHMCYSEFNDIIDAIEAMDADVISIENARSGLELLAAFTTSKYPRMIGPGVYDVHSPQIPETDEIVQRLRRSAGVLGDDVLWVNPDCGLKTRGDAEVWPSLEHMVGAARALRGS